MRSSHFVLFVLLSSILHFLVLFPRQSLFARNLFLENILLVPIPNILRTKNLIHSMLSDPKICCEVLDGVFRPLSTSS